MPHRIAQLPAPGPAVRERASDANGAQGVEAVRVLHDGEFGEASQGREVDVRVLGFGRVGDGGADYGDGDGDVGGPAEGYEVRFYGWRGRDGGVVLRRGMRRDGEVRVDGGGGRVLWVHV